MNKTLNYNLNKPEADDFYDIDIFNQNTDKIDIELKKLLDKIVPAKQNVICITESGKITLPQNVKYIDIMIVNSGSGGQGGTGSHLNGSSSGNGGAGGLGGKVISFNNLKLTGSITVNIGAAGIGGAGGLGSGANGSPQTGLLGTTGGITTVTINGVNYNSTTFSSHINQMNPIFCTFTAEFYGKDGVNGAGGNGIKYGDGGNGGTGGLKGGDSGGNGGSGAGGCLLIHYIGDE